MKNKKLIAVDLLKEELDELSCKYEIGLTTSQNERYQILKSAIQELESLALKSDCINCKYHLSLEELQKLSDEESFSVFENCSSCSNYYTNNYETK